MADAGFTEERARAVLAAALPHGTGDATGARLLALGENAVFALDHLSLVVRVSRDLAVRERAARELRVADWLAREGVPAVRPDRRFGGAEQPLAHDGHLVTYWQQLPPPERPAGPRDLAALLRRVHALPDAPPDLALPRRDLLGGVERWLRLAGEAIDPADAAYLRARRDDIAAATAELTPHLAPGPIHGDALPRNVHIGPDGPVLVDLETFATDLREHDLVVMALSRDRYGLGAAAYDEFTAAYGWDVREWPGCAVLRGARETASCAWVAQHAPGNPAALAEFRRRVASLREGDAAVRWYAF
ncbi:phosphotransferase enzyme family protein [Streptomyces sp. Rer75]|uniref:phosphotransferase enzyme family protein n=1 Tax=unclassified Streptomyces TaxID=2593676 RepID=UPI0015CF9CF7|nr:aminoglycoside phosphotransferase family protein [Streptomyces sp. Rer75]QLH24736.1 aminoglycoside phosphotransferase family protein [Streptomyces sp. Rer75]